MKQIYNEVGCWKPLEDLFSFLDDSIIQQIPELFRSDLISWYMYMEKVISTNGIELYIYKNSCTRRCITIDIEGNCYFYIGSPNVYNKTSVESAILYSTS